MIPAAIDEAVIYDLVDSTHPDQNETWYNVLVTESPTRDETTQVGQLLVRQAHDDWHQRSVDVAEEGHRRIHRDLQAAH